MERVIHLIDFQNMVYRYASALNLSVEVAGVEVNTSVLYGLLKYIKSIHNPTIFCLEGYPKLFKYYDPSYKGNRSKEKEDKVSVPMSDVIKVCCFYATMRGIDVKFAFSPNQEADQVVASIQKALFNKRLQLFQSESPETDFFWKRYTSLKYTKLQLPEVDRVLIKTTDSDMYQLIDERTGIANQLSDNTGVRETPKAVNHLPPGTIPVYKAFVGDKSDNVPSVIKGFSEKRFLSIITDVLTDKVDLEKFINLTREHKKYNGAEDLQKHVMEKGNLDRLSINQKITTLTFYSMPWSLIPKDYDSVVSLIDKYKLKL